MTVKLNDAIEAAAEGEIRSVCLYCGSSDHVPPEYLEAARVFGKSVAEAGLRLVYGGGGVGLMGAGAEAAHKAGGKVLGIMPQFLRSRERLFDDVETRVVTSMHERKMMMFEESDAFVVMPGGIGTLEEVVELLSWRRLDLHKKPIIFYNPNNFWDPLFTLIKRFKDDGFAPAAIDLTYTSVERIEEILAGIASMKLNNSSDIDTRKVI